MKLPILLAVVTATMGCQVGPGGVEAPSFAKITSPEDVDLTWNEYSQNTERVGSLILLDFFVFNGDTGLPMDNIKVEILSRWDGAFLIPKSAVKIVPPPEDLSEEDCDANADGAIDEDAPDACSWNWDTSGDQYFELASEFADAYHPNYMEAKSNEHGVLRVWTYVESLPLKSRDEAGNDSYGEFAVWASIGHMSVEVTFAPSSD
jgi:hypothetical protein